jgi:hypothetical protein
MNRHMAESLITQIETYLSKRYDDMMAGSRTCGARSRPLSRICLT